MSAIWFRSQSVKPYWSNKNVENIDISVEKCSVDGIIFTEHWKILKLH